MGGGHICVVNVGAGAVIMGSQSPSEIITLKLWCLTVIISSRYVTRYFLGFILLYNPLYQIYQGRTGGYMSIYNAELCNLDMVIGLFLAISNLLKNLQILGISR